MSDDIVPPCLDAIPPQIRNGTVSHIGVHQKLHSVLYSVHFNQSYVASCNGELHQVKCALIISQDCCKKGEYFIQPLLVVNRENLAKTNQVWRKSICNQIQMELSRLRFKVKTPPIILL